jgi:hypothetical protein
MRCQLRKTAEYLQKHVEVLVGGEVRDVDVAELASQG